MSEIVNVKSLANQRGKPSHGTRLFGRVNDGLFKLDADSIGIGTHVNIPDHT